MPLPPELVEQIIDYLALQNLDPAELLPFGVVARAWRPRALSYVFRTIHVSCLRRATDGLAFDSDTFTRLQNAAPHLLRHLRHLTVRIDGNCYQVESARHFACVLSLQAVETLRFEDLTPSARGSAGLFADYALRFPALRRLELRLLGMLPLAELAKATAVARELALVFPEPYHEFEALPISAASAGSDTGVTPTIPNLRSLELENPVSRINVKFYADVARLCACAPNLERVVVTRLDIHTLDRFITASSAFKDLIQDLEFDVGIQYKLTQTELDGVLHQFPNLRVLRLDAPGPSDRLPFPSAAKTLERLCFTINNVDAATDRFWSPRVFEYACDWPALDSCASSRATMPALKKLELTFVVSSSDLVGWEATLGALAKTHLPLLYNAGMLEWSAVQRRGARSLGGTGQRR